MKFPTAFRVRYALLGSALLLTVGGNAQDNTGNKPEMAAPSAQMAEHASAGHKEKTPSTTLTITLQSATVAAGDKILTLTPADIAALPHEAVTVINGHTNASETYSGVPIAVLLARLGLPFEKANEHTLLRTCLIAEGTDGYRVLISVYETLAPIRGTSAIVADTLDGKKLTTDGAFKLIIPGDKRPQRWVQNLKSITFKTIE